MTEVKEACEAEINVGQYVNEMISELGRFYDYYNVWVEVQPDKFPERMPPGEWDVQFQAWSQSKIDGGGGESDGSV